MADVQKQFIDFDGAIRLERKREEALLRSKRGNIVERLKQQLGKMLVEPGRKTPNFQWYNQGSYALHTGIKAIHGDFDIDVGLIFHVAKEDYPNPMVVKEWVYQALKNFTDRVEMRNPCITVYYRKKHRTVCHVDLAVYCDKSKDGRVYLARGKANAQPGARSWEIADPRGLVTKLDERFCGEEQRQFRRVVRFLKRWRDEQFPKEDAARPSGISLTLAVHQWLPTKSTGAVNDLKAMRSVVRSMLGAFRAVEGDNRRLIIKLPVSPREDVLADMSQENMEQFRPRLESLVKTLQAAIESSSTAEACRLLGQQFGSDFPQTG